MIQIPWRKQFSTVLGSSIKTPSSELNNEEKFSGANNPLVYTRFYDLTFKCRFRLENYPFDYQACSIEVNRLFIFIKQLVVLK